MQNLNTDKTLLAKLISQPSEYLEKLLTSQKTEHLRNLLSVTATVVDKRTDIDEVLELMASMDVSIDDITNTSTNWVALDKPEVKALTLVDSHEGTVVSTQAKTDEISQASKSRNLRSFRAKVIIGEAIISKQKENLKLKDICKEMNISSSTAHYCKALARAMILIEEKYELTVSSIEIHKGVSVDILSRILTDFTRGGFTTKGIGCNDHIRVYEWNTFRVVYYKGRVSVRSDSLSNKPKLMVLTHAAYDHAIKNLA